MQVGRDMTHTEKSVSSSKPPDNDEEPEYNDQKNDVP